LSTDVTGFVFIGTQNFDVIRFATYRTACKLRFVQKRTNRKFVAFFSCLFIWLQRNLLNM